MKRLLSALAVLLLLVMTVPAISRTLVCEASQTFGGKQAVHRFTVLLPASGEANYEGSLAFVDNYGSPHEFGPSHVLRSATLEWEAPGIDDSYTLFQTSRGVDNPVFVGLAISSGGHLLIVRIDRRKGPPYSFDFHSTYTLHETYEGSCE